MVWGVEKASFCTPKPMCVVRGCSHRMGRLQAAALGKARPGVGASSTSEGHPGLDMASAGQCSLHTPGLRLRGLTAAACVMGVGMAVLRIS